MSSHALPQGIFPTQGKSKPTSLALADRFSTTEPTWEAHEDTGSILSSFHPTTSGGSKDWAASYVALAASRCPACGLPGVLSWERGVSGPLIYVTNVFNPPATLVNPSTGRASVFAHPCLPLPVPIWLLAHWTDLPLCSSPYTVLSCLSGSWNQALDSVVHSRRCINS